MICQNLNCRISEFEFNFKCCLATLIFDSVEVESAVISFNHLVCEKNPTEATVETSDSVLNPYRLNKIQNE